MRSQNEIEKGASVPFSYRCYKYNMRFKEFITETYINAIRPADKQKYAEQIWDMLQASYAKLPGGFATAAT